MKRCRFKRFTPEMGAYIRRCVDAGWPDQRIAAVLHTSSRSVADYRNSVGLGRHARSGGAINRWSEDQLALLGELAALDLTAYEIAKRLDKSKRAVIGIANRRGIRIKPGVPTRRDYLKPSDSADEPAIAAPTGDFASLIGSRRFEDDPRSTKPQPAAVVYRPATHVMQVGQLG